MHAAFHLALLVPRTLVSSAENLETSTLSFIILQNRPNVAHISMSLWRKQHSPTRVAILPSRRLSLLPTHL
jgi:hypothetical protein